jgi:hypothetical protein
LWDEAPSSGQGSGKVLPYEFSDRPHSPVGAVQWLYNRKLLNPHILTLSKAFYAEFLASVFPKSRVTVSIEYFALDEFFEPLALDYLKAPKILLRNSEKVDIKVRLVPRVQFLRGSPSRVK